MIGGAVGTAGPKPRLRDFIPQTSFFASRLSYVCLQCSDYALSISSFVNCGTKLLFQRTRKMTSSTEKVSSQETG